MNDQEGLRIKYKLFLKETGVNQKFLCSKLGINESVMSRFRNGRLKLPSYDFISLRDYISKAGY